MQTHICVCFSILEKCTQDVLSFFYPDQYLEILQPFNINKKADYLGKWHLSTFQNTPLGNSHTSQSSSKFSEQSIKFPLEIDISSLIIGFLILDTIWNFLFNDYFSFQKNQQFQEAKSNGDRMGNLCNIIFCQKAPNLQEMKNGQS